MNSSWSRSKNILGGRWNLAPLRSSGRRRACLGSSPIAPLSSRQLGRPFSSLGSPRVRGAVQRPAHRAPRAGLLLQHLGSRVMPCLLSCLSASSMLQFWMLLAHLHEALNVSSMSILFSRLPKGHLTKLINKISIKKKKKGAQKSEILVLSQSKMLLNY
uniref:Uncharacterized protein n=1 Tax=Kalanchoe fedtschenkoi TaxID=63787 RepID=A0A7N0VJE1_KALFE